MAHPRWVWERSTSPHPPDEPSASAGADGLAAGVEQGEGGVDGLVGRDHVGREHGRVDLARPTHQELERHRTVKHPLEAVLRSAEGTDIHHVADGTADHRLGSVGHLVGDRTAVRDLLSEELREEHLQQLDLDALVEQVLGHEGLDRVGISTDDLTCLERIQICRVVHEGFLSVLTGGRQQHLLPFARTAHIR